MSQLDIVGKNFRSLALSLAISSHLMNMIIGPLVIGFCVILGIYYGIKIEKETFVYKSTYK
jgi:hypothetical protein